MRLNNEAVRYIRKIRNEAKRAYAEIYAHYLLFGGQEPQHPGLGTMAAQAVRIELSRLVRAS